MWKLELGLAPYIVTTGVGTVTLAVVIKKCWMTQQSLSDTNTSKKYRSQKPSKPHPEKGEELTDDFSLPRYIRVLVLNYQPMQTIFAISKDQYHVHEMKPDEEFAPNVTIVDYTTQQTLDCVLLLYGDKPPEVSCRTLFCYIAVEITVVPYYVEHDSHPHPLHYIESKPCKQGKLPLVFHFHQPGIACDIQLSIYSLVDSEGVEYMHNSENCNCIVLVVDREQQSPYLRVQHGVVRVKQPSFIRYTGPLATKSYHELESQFIKLYLCPDHRQIQRFSKRILVESSINPDIKVFALCWKALSVIAREDYERAEKLLKSAWKKASKLECQNGLLLQGRVLRHLAFMQYAQHNDDKALEYISGAKERLFNAAPSNETAFNIQTELLVKLNRRLLKYAISSEQYESTARQCELLLEHGKYMEEYEKPLICNLQVVKASFHLRSTLVTDKLPPREYWPSDDDLKKAEECLNSVSLEMMPNQVNFYIYSKILSHSL